MFEAFSIGPFIIWSRALFEVVGVLLATEFFLRLARGANLSLQHFYEHALQYLIGFLVGVRLFAVIAEFRVYLRDPFRVFIVWDGGFSFLGGAIGIGFVLFLATRRQRTTFLQWLDALVPAATLGLAFDWLGRFFAGSAYGKPTDFFWGVTYEAIRVRYTVPIHPVQLYYALSFLLLTFALLVLRKRNFRAGTQTFLGIFSASLLTFAFEYFRGDFSIPVFATRPDFVVLLLLFLSLGVFAAMEIHVSRKALMLYEVLLVALFGGYLIARSVLDFPTMELRFPQLLAVLALLATTVYVIVHRKKYPHL